MTLDELGPGDVHDQTPGSDAVEPLDPADMVSHLSRRTAELDAVAWNLPRPSPQPFPPDEAWPPAGDAS